MAVNKLFSGASSGDDEHWISVSDLMAGLMVIFLFIAISYMRDIITEKERIEQIAVTWSETQDALYVDLEKEFERDLPRWNAALDRDTLSIRFKEPSVLFNTGDAELKTKFKAILSDFFPRYLKLLRNYQGDIAEVRVEGHTSSVWEGARDGGDAYFRNLELSQDRTRSVLRYCLQILAANQDRDWVRQVITANGLSSSRLILNSEGQEDAALSRRVEFRVRTNAERQIVNILRAR